MGRLGYGILTLVVLASVAACSKLKHSDPAGVNRVVKPIGLQGKIRTDAELKASQQVNATYYYLLGQWYEGRENDAQALVAFERVKQFDAESSFIQLALAQSYLKKGLVEEGVASARKSLELDPKNRDAKVLLGNLYATTKKYEEADRLFGEAEAQNPDDEEIVLYRVLLDIERRLIPRAHVRLKDYIKRNQESPLAYFYLGRIEQEMKNYKGAREAYETAVELRPGFVQAGTYLALLYEETKEKEKALETYAWLANATDSATFHQKLGQVYLDDHNYEDALKSLLNLERVEPTHLNNKMKIGLLYFEMKDYKPAIRRFEEVLRASPDSDNVLYYLGAAYEQNKDYSRALDTFERIKPDSKLYHESLKRRAGVLIKEKKKDKGWELVQKEFQSAVQGNTLAEDHFELMVGFLDETEQWPQALIHLGEGLQKFRDSERLLYMRGALYEKLDRADEAIVDMQRILKKNPRHAGALNFVGYLWAERGTNLSAAEDYIRRALLQKADDPFVIDSLGWVLYRQGRFKEAFAQVEKAFKMRPDESVIAAHLAEILAKLGRLEEARVHFEKALELGAERAKLRAEWEFKLQSVRKQLDQGADRKVGGAAVPSALGGVRDPRQPASTPAGH